MLVRDILYIIYSRRSSEEHSKFEHRRVICCCLCQETRQTWPLLSLPPSLASRLPRAIHFPRLKISRRVYARLVNRADKIKVWVPLLSHYFELYLRSELFLGPCDCVETRYTIFRNEETFFLSSPLPDFDQVRSVAFFSQVKREEVENGHVAASKPFV